MQYLKYNKDNDLTRWHRWFAWYPVEIGRYPDDTKTIAWLEYVDRCMIILKGPIHIVFRKYRRLTDHP